MIAYVKVSRNLPEILLELRSLTRPQATKQAEPIVFPYTNSIQKYLGIEMKGEMFTLAPPKRVLRYKSDKARTGSTCQEL